MFFSGVIEGFYGHVWPWPQRHSMVDFLAAQNLRTYVYAPKADRVLRSHWREDYDEAEFKPLLALREHCRQQGVAFGIGFSPWGLQASYTAADRAALQRKFLQLQQLDVDLLCVLFDDMPGSFAQLAARQVAIVEDLAALSGAKRLIMCPTYYSFDPILEQLFGAMPPNYLEDLGRMLPASVDVFWTGSQVLAPGFTGADLIAISDRIQRKPVLWDNYPVNDGRKSSRFLHVLPVRNRPWQLCEWSAGHLANPMNQPELSKLPLASLAASYARRGNYLADQLWQEQLDTLGDAGMAGLLARDAVRFQRDGLDAIPASERIHLASEYRLQMHPMAAEVAHWLEERYRFDPACLND